MPNVTSVVCLMSLREQARRVDVARAYHRLPSRHVSSILRHIRSSCQHIAGSHLLEAMVARTSMHENWSEAAEKPAVTVTPANVWQYGTQV